MNLAKLGWNEWFEEQLFDKLEQDRFIARVICVQKGSYLVQDQSGVHAATITGKLRHQATKTSDLPVVGDWVEINDHQRHDSVVILGLIPRKNSISRQVAGGAKLAGGLIEEQMIAANVDTIFIVSGLDRDYNLRRIERYLSLAYGSETKPVVVLNKADLCDDPLSRLVEVESIAMGVVTHVISACYVEDLDVLRQYLQAGVTIALLGSSGAGKSTIINGLLGHDHQAVRSVSASVGKGVHTTTQRELIVLPGGGMLIDNPGIRELQLWEDEESLDMAFSDIEHLSRNCRFSDCAHGSEPGCAVKASIEEGLLDEDRLISFQKLRKELTYLSGRRKENARMLERQQGREFAQMKKEIYRIKMR